MGRPAIATPGTVAARTLGDRRSVPDVRWIGQLTGASPPEVRRILREVDDLLEVERAIRAAHEEGGRTFYAQFRAPFDIYALVRLRRPAEVVETGVSSGVSSAHFLLGLQANEGGRLHSVDLPTRQRGAKLGASESPVSLPPGRQPGWAVPSELSRGWDLRLGPSERLLPGLVSELDEVSIFLHDSHHTPKHLTFELETVRPWLRQGAIVMADNTQWTGNAFDRFAASIGAPVVRRRRSDLVGLRVPANAE